ncbi:uncharacterized protein LOC131649723 [Vicia villosa]|uniref:uncharacterized protein LOC131649723 n=1 Tax=Vicia villosa TaxID=3911 RepID=UPI00273C5CE7|nr:uncharacterized protein LOC131649723 [Vicia villosa]
MVGNRDISDHFLITLNLGKVDWGLKPFRFNNICFKHDSFIPFIHEEWSKISLVGRGDFVLYEKLKRLKPCLKDWNRDVFGWIDLRVSDKVKELNDLDGLMVDNFVENNGEIVKDRGIMGGDMWDALNLKESMLRMKLRQLWLKEGDRNMRCFHKSLKERYRRNVITNLEGESGKIEGPEGIKEVMKAHFEDFFKESDSSRPVSEGL